MKIDDLGISKWDNILYSIQVTIVTSFQLNIVLHKILHAVLIALEDL